MFKKTNLTRAVIAGLTGTTAMTALMLAAPAMGMPPMNIGEMLGAMMGGRPELGWAAHFMIGTTLAVTYAAFLARRIPVPAPIRGMLFSLAPWILAQVVVMPMAGMGLFSGSPVLAAGSLMGHLVFGAVAGAVYGRGERATSWHPTHTHA